MGLYPRNDPGEGGPGPHLCRGPVSLFLSLLWPDFDDTWPGSLTIFHYLILKVGTGKILSVRNSVVDPYTVQIFEFICTLEI